MSIATNELPHVRLLIQICQGGCLQIYGLRVQHCNAASIKVELIY